MGQIDAIVAADVTTDERRPNAPSVVVDDRGGARRPADRQRQ
jgi:hypothetical protein